MYPTKQEIWHFKKEIPNNISKDNVLKYMCEEIRQNNISKDIVLKYMIEEIRQKFWDYDVVIILEKGKVIEIIN